MEPAPTQTPTWAIDPEVIMANRAPRQNRSLRGITADTAIQMDSGLAADCSTSLGGNTVLTVHAGNAHRVIRALQEGEESVRETLSAQRAAAIASGDRAAAANAASSFNAYRSSVAKLVAFFPTAEPEASGEEAPAAEEAPAPRRKRS
jgi:hypothetical protein